MSRPRTRLFTTSAALACALAACGGSDSKDPITIGLLMPITGDIAAFGKEFSDASLLAIDDINAHGGLLDGHEVKLTVKDTGTSPTGAMIGYNALVNEHVTAILGPAASSEVVAIREQLKTGEAISISPSASSPVLSTLDFGGNFYRLAASDAVQGKVLAELIDAANLDKLCLAIRNDEYGNGVADAVKAKLATLPNNPPSIITATFPPTASDLSTVLAPCGAPDRTGGKKNGILFVTLISDGAALMDSASSTYGWDPAMGDKVFLTDGTRDKALVSLLADPAFVEGAVGTASTGPMSGTPEAAELDAFKAAFSAKFGRDKDVYAEMAYDGAYVSAMAIELAGDASDPAALREALGKISSGTEVAVGNWAAIKAEIAKSGKLDFRGASGAVSLMPPSVDTGGPYYIEVWTITGGVATQQRVEVVPSI